MADYRLSNAARADILAIDREATKQWGEERSYRYLAELGEVFLNLAAFPQSGRDASAIRAGYRRFEHESHVIFYRPDKAGIVIMRVLHQRMLPRWHL